VDPIRCKDSCSGHGECQALITDVQIVSPEKTINKETFVWFCNKRYIGESWNDWAKGFYGPKCKPWKKNPADGVIWGSFGICDDGIEGSGDCLCRDPDLEPSLFWESASRESIMEEEENFTMLFFAILCIIFLSLLVLFMYNKIPFLDMFPECIMAVLLGIGIGWYLKFAYEHKELIHSFKFEPHTYFLLLLPPIMFQVGFSMNASTFFRNIMTINAFAIGGTMIQSVIFGTVIYYLLSLTSLSYHFFECVQLGWIISAIDPVATMTTFKNMQLNEKIYMYVFGESTLNNAVVIALWAAIEGIKHLIRQGEELDLVDIGIFSLETFWFFFFGSFLIGAAWAIFISFVIAQLEFDDIPWIEIAFFSLSCYFPYIFWEAIGWSGFLSIFIWGMMMRNYAFQSLSMCSEVTVEYLVDTIAFTTENFIFAYLGICIPLLVEEINFAHVGAGLLAFVISRICSVMIVSFVLNLIKTKKIPFSHQAVLFFWGIRGAVAFYLALNMTILPDVSIIVKF
jgi:solute carrier family 9 (sodium/hydrogen exchanger), member 8